MSDEGPWSSIHYTLDDQRLGYLIEHAEDGVCSYRVEAVIWTVRGGLSGL